MRVIQIHSYGGPEVLKIEEKARPEPQIGEVLLRVYAAGVNPIDWKIRQGLMKASMPVTFPYTPGIEVVGMVEEVGPGVAAFKRGGIVNLTKKWKSFFYGERRRGGKKRSTGEDGVGVSGSFPAGHLVPDQEATLHEGAVIPGRKAVPFGPKVIQDWPKRREKPLGVSRRFEASHSSLALPRWLM